VVTEGDHQMWRWRSEAEGQKESRTVRGEGWENRSEGGGWNDKWNHEIIGIWAFELIIGWGMRQKIGSENGGSEKKKKTGAMASARRRRKRKAKSV